jgi:hypothetical protein
MCSRVGWGVEGVDIALRALKWPNLHKRIVTQKDLEEWS